MSRDEQVLGTCEGLRRADVVAGQRPPTLRELLRGQYTLRNLRMEQHRDTACAAMSSRTRMRRVVIRGCDFRRGNGKGWIVFSWATMHPCLPET